MEVLSLHQAGAEAAPVPAATLAVPELTVILPTYNERANVPLIVTALRRALAGIAFEVVFVDDNSPDGTAAIAHEIAATDPRVRVIRRIGRRGLAGACIEGMLSSSAPFVAVMDADLQHDETLLPKMLAALKAGDLDLAVASRRAEGGAIGEGLSKVRAAGSNLANALAQRLLKVTLTDPMSGFFMLRRPIFDELAPKLSAQGFKILLDIVVSGEGRLRIVEFPFVFRERREGESKLDTLVTFDYLGLLVSKYFGDRVSVRFLMFSLVGASGVLVHLLALRGSMIGLGLDFNMAQTLATFVAMTTNFALNNRLTYRDRRLSGLAMLRGLLTFYAVCSAGVLANVGVANMIYQSEPVWWLAGMAGAAMGAVWNYNASSVLTWRKP
ncbi:MAG: glycosyltransferase family 2 protein [Methylobacterium sp.]|jgi:dolichol-phosphate mannosyltransferase|nr:glycosyltransferase family 2 protein [Methylobacterium sp.]MCA3640395.1 glycosyltransferase family 2 protein [Methylobacterium sp.]MCA3647341.1 glycosyltransferase family 2 protein [Methylobacterium sp.]MCA3652552.1 glycosyltransferase family 2 protein [Methylobacterium sp.]MCA4922453.1 glycosyltransferase family 2 protein [Methylobacterium sp.]